MDWVTGVKIVLGLLMVVAIIGVVMAGVGVGSGLISEGMRTVVSEAAFDVPYGMPMIVARWAFDSLYLVTPLVAFIGWCVGAAALVGTWRIVRMFL